MKLGDIVKFSSKHYAESPGHAYVENWLGIVIESKTGKPARDGTWEERHFCRGFDEVEIMWSHDGITHLSKYDEEWWNKLDYDPFEVINEDR